MVQRVKFFICSYFYVHCDVLYEEKMKEKPKTTYYCLYIFIYEIYAVDCTYHCDST